MKQIVIVLGAVLALGLSSTAIATAADEPKDCGAALALLADARVKADAGNAEIARLRDAQRDLDTAVDSAQKALDAATDPVKIPALQAALNLAKKTAADAQKVLDDKVNADLALDKLAVDAQVKVSVLCKGEDAPKDEDKPTQVKRLPKVAPATGSA